MYSTPNTVFPRQKCVNHCSDNCNNQENIQTVNCNGLYRQMCSKSEPATTQGAAYMNFYCITYTDMLRRQEGKLMPSFTVQKQVINPLVLLGLLTNFRFGCYYIILYYCIHEAYTHNNHVFTKNNIFIYHSHQHVSLLVFNWNFKLQLQNQRTSIHK